MEGKMVDFSKKRLQFWLETVPPDLRRLEYELYKRNRKLISADLYKLEHKKKYGRFTFMPGFTEDLEQNAWENFRDSFLKGGDRKERFSEIVNMAQRDLPMILEKYSTIIPKDKVKLIALGGSSFYGPRRTNERLSDVDLNFLIDEETDSLNFNVWPDSGSFSKETPYHLFGTGYGDKARGSGRELHWLLYPHFPIRNSFSDKELKSIIENLVLATEKRKEDLLESIKKLDNLLKEKSQDDTIE